MAKGCFDDQKKKMERDKRFFPEVLSQMINNDVDAWEVKFFIRIPTKYVIKYTVELILGDMWLTFLNFEVNLAHGENSICRFYCIVHGCSNKNLRFPCVNITQIYF